jgi:predicted permease
MRTFLRLETLWGDVRYVARSLRRHPGFLVAVLLSLGLGIGANSTLFSVINAVIYRPLPYQSPERLMTVWQTDQHGGWNRPPIADSLDWDRQKQVFEQIGLTSGAELLTMSGAGAPAMIPVQFSTPDFFTVLGVKPALGRVFVGSEMQDRAQTILISDSFWKERFSGNPEVLGKAIDINGKVSTIVGVMPPGLGSLLGDRVDVWQPIDPVNVRYSPRVDHWLMAIARLKAGVTRDRAQVEMDIAARRLAQAYPKTNRGAGIAIVPMQEALFGPLKDVLYPLMGAVAFVLLIGCVNVANLLRSRTETRRRECAVRVSLGAGRWHLIRLSLVESGLLAFLGGCLGIALTFAGIRLFHALAGDFPNANAITIDARVLLFTLAISLGTAVLVGLGSALGASRLDLDTALRNGDQRTTSALERGHGRQFLVIAEVALAMVLLVGAGLTINSLLRLEQVNPGFDPANVVTMRILLPEGGKYLTQVPGKDIQTVTPRVAGLFSDLLERIEALPAVESVGIISQLPTRGAEMRGFTILGHAPPPAEERPTADFEEVTGGFFRALKIPLKKGRFPNAHDTAKAPWVAVANEAFVRRYFPDEDPIGQRVLVSQDFSLDEPQSREIVGVAADIKQYGPGGPTRPMLYTSFLQQPLDFFGGSIDQHIRQDLVIRTSAGFTGADSTLVREVKEAVAQIDPNQPVTDVMTMNQAMAESIRYPHLYMTLLEIFAGIAVFLAMIGIYGVMSYFVMERTHEIGVRIALGARRSQILSLVVGLGLKLTAIGLIVGAALAIAVTRAIADVLFGVSATDPLTFVLVALALAAIALLACYIPAHRASRIEPMVALRNE